MIMLELRGSPEASKSAKEDSVTSLHHCTTINLVAGIPRSILMCCKFLNIQIPKCGCHWHPKDPHSTHISKITLTWTTIMEQV